MYIETDTDWYTIFVYQSDDPSILNFVSFNTYFVTDAIETKYGAGQRKDK